MFGGALSLDVEEAACIQSYTSEEHGQCRQTLPCGAYPEPVIRARESREPLFPVEEVRRSNEYVFVPDASPVELVESECVQAQALVRCAMPFETELENPILAGPAF